MDDFIKKAYAGGLSKTDRRDMVEQYKAEEMKVQNIKAPKGKVLSKEDPLNMPRHKVYNDHICFVECPLCFKCRNFDSSKAECMGCVLFDEALICNTFKHNDKVLNMMIRRERIDLDGIDFQIHYKAKDGVNGYISKIVLPGGQVLLAEDSETGYIDMEQTRHLVGKTVEYFINNDSEGKFIFESLSETGAYTLVTA